jgi:hypothetical protein
MSTIPPAAPPGARALEERFLNGIFFGNSNVGMRDVIDGTSTTVMIGESYTDPTYTKDGQGMDFWQFGCPQSGGWVAGGLGGTEHTEGLASTGPKLNSRRDPTVHGVIMEIAFGSYHPSGAMFGLADGSVRFISDTVDLTIYHGIGSRDQKEIVGDF